MGSPPGPTLHLRTLTRGDGLLGLLPCGPVPRGQRAPLIGARAVPVSLAWLDRDDAAADDTLRRLGLHPLPRSALQWRGTAPALPADRPDAALWTLVQEADFAALWAEQLPALKGRGWRIVVEPGFAHASTPVGGWRLALAPLQGPPGMGSWLLSLGVEIDGESLDLAPMLARLFRQDRRWLHADALADIGDDEIICLKAPGGRLIDAPAAPLKAIASALLDLLARPRLREGPLKLSAWDAPRLAELRDRLGHDAPWALRGAAGLQALQARLAALGPPPPVAAPAGLGVVLRPYQLDGLAWLQQLRAQGLGALLADDMGLGKTAQALAHLLVEQQAGRLDQPALVVAPASLLFNWQAEAQRCTPALRVLVLQGPRRQASLARLAEHDLVITSYPLLRRDLDALARQPWHLVILDEAQMVKNAASQAAAAARRLQARQRISLTGTPMENHLGELWAQCHFLLPGLLGTMREFKRQWRDPIEKNGETARARLLARRVAPFLLRRRKDEVATELPPLTEQLLRVRLQGRQRALYESVRLAADRQVRRVLERAHGPGARLGVLGALLRLRQVCNDARLLLREATPPGMERAKIELLQALLPTLVAEGRRVLVFSQFSRMLGLIEPELDALGLRWLSLTGRTPPPQREDRVRRFQAGEAEVFLVSLKAGGTGLNLTAADTVIHVDPWWNPAVEHQASARAHRIGQQRPVHVLRLVAEGSLEERMLALQQRKAALADSVLGGAVAIGDDELLDLLAPLD